jgi:natural product biosynthesis luciferase-like monooxygenase protein
MEFSLSYFSANGTSAAPDKYRLVLDGARFADVHGFRAVWLPERHFQEFGGAYPNPSVLAAAVAATTRQVRIRSGSVVMPLHHPLRVAEEWSVVDNLSGGRVDMSFASGWHPADFVLSTGQYEDRKRLMFEGIDAVQRLWRGETARFPRPDGLQLEVSVFPKPVQKTLPVWITTSGSPQTWQSAGELGAGILCALIGDSMTGLASKIQIYRRALVESGGDPARGHVTVMLHTFLGENGDTVKAQVRKPMHSYIRSYMRQKEDPNLKNKPASGADLSKLSEGEKDGLAGFALERYFQGNALFGTVDKCIRIVDQLRDVGVDEIACLIDFGVPVDAVIESLAYLDQLRAHYAVAA